MSDTRTAVLALEAGSTRLDKALAAAWPDLSRSRLQALVRAGHLTVGGEVVRDPSCLVPDGAAVALDEPPVVPPEPKPQPIPLVVVYEDDTLIVIDKPAGLVVHPAAGHADGTLVNALIAHCGASLSGIGGVARPGIVHRIDKDTSGLLVVAKTDRAHASLAAQFADHGRSGPLQREYLAFVWGRPEPAAGTVRAALARSTRDREKIAIVAEGRGREAVTHYRLRETYGGRDGEPVASLVTCRLETGRTHQIRVHLAHLRHPLVGDDVYGAGFRTKATRLPDEAAERVGGLRRQALHAALLQIEHPVTRDTMRFESALPPDLAGLRAALAGPDAPDLLLPPVAPGTNSRTAR